MSETHLAAPSQPLQAVRRADRVRIVRSELKAQIADGQGSAAEIILTCPPRERHHANRTSIGDSTRLG
jgi:hypothetical protein